MAGGGHAPAGGVAMGGASGRPPRAAGACGRRLLLVTGLVGCCLAGAAGAAQAPGAGGALGRRPAACGGGAFAFPGGLPIAPARGAGLGGRGGCALRRSLPALRAALGLRVVNISKTKEKWADTACDDYAKRVRKMGVDLQEVVIKPAPGPPKFTAEQQKDEEGRTLLSRVDIASETLIILDERGDMLTSHELAELLRRTEDDGVRTLTFAIGGAHGHGKEVQDKAHRALSLSKMVMNHQIARVVLLEQLYRAYTILRGVPYHK